MVLGRLAGTFLAVTLAAVFHNDNPIVEVLLIFVYTIFGVGVGILASLLFGPNISNDEPHLQDSEDYWVAKYGESLGKKAYLFWLEELDKTE